MLENRKKILLVDDDRMVLQLFSHALTNEGFQCFPADSVKEAILILANEIPDIILSDYLMPDQDGFDFRKYVLLDKRLKNIPFVFLTSYTDRKLMQQGLDMQAVDYIDKITPVPLVISKLNNILHTISKEHEKSIYEIRAAAEALNLRSVPAEPPRLDGYFLNFLYKSFEDYPGGDFIDFITIDDKYTFIILGDVMGKKWGAWFFSFNFLSYIRSAIRLCVFDENFSTSSILHKINKVILMDPVLSDVLSTLTLLMLEHETGELHYSGAGDLPLVLFSANENELVAVQSAGLLLGVMQDGLYDEKTVTLNKGDQLLVVSDGMIEFSRKDGGKKSDYDLFFSQMKSYLGHENSFNLIKDVTFSAERSKELIDDCSLIFLQKN